jgi:hypothetical protein
MNDPGHEEPVVDRPEEHAPVAHPQTEPGSGALERLYVEVLACFAKGAERETNAFQLTRRADSTQIPLCAT